MTDRHLRLQPETTKASLGSGRYPCYAPRLAASPGRDATAHRPVFCTQGSHPMCPHVLKWSLAAKASAAALIAVAIVLVGTASSSAVAATSGLVAAYSFEAGQGTTVADNSGTGNTGTLSNATWTSAGKNGGALSFNGSNSSVSIPNSSSLTLSSGMTLEAWVRPTALGGSWRTVLFKEKSGGTV